MATLKNDLAQHNLTLKDAIELALDKPLWRLLAASGNDGACRIMMMNDVLGKITGHCRVHCALNQTMTILKLVYLRRHRHNHI